MMRKLTMAAVAAVTAFGSAPAAADTICEWIDFSQTISVAAAPAPGSPRVPDHDRAVTQVALAMFEAVNAIDRRYESYLGLPARAGNASQDAAAITAAYRVMFDHYPSQRATLDDA